MKNLKLLILFISLLFLNGLPLFAQDDSATKQESFGYVFDKISSDEELKKDAEKIKLNHNIDILFSKIKRNKKGEIIAIKISYTDDKGNSDQIEVKRKIPIRPIFFKATESINKNSGIGFYDNSSMIKKTKDPKLEKIISTIESLKDDAIIYVDGEEYNKENLELLDPASLVSIEILKGKNVIEKYGKKGKKGVVIVSTNWKQRT